MNTEHAAEFDQALAACMELYGRGILSDNALRLFWESLQDFSWPMVRSALQEHVRESPFPPKPADLISRLVVRDGRPTADEAWAVALMAQDESQTIIWTGEIATAASTAQPVLDAGDEVGARRAFIDNYNRQVQEARRALRPASWSASLGTDPRTRDQVITSAVASGKLNRDFARAVLAPPCPAPSTGKVAALSSPAHPLATVHELPDLDTRNRRRFLSIVQAAIDARPGFQSGAQQRSEVRRRADQDQAQAHRESEVARLKMIGRRS